MNRLFVLCFLFCYVICTAYGDIPKTTVKSPSGIYVCKIESDRTISFTRKGQKEQIQVMKFERWVEIFWSPRDTWFCVLDHNDPHSIGLSIFCIVENNLSQKMRVEKVYESPWATHDDAYWRMVRWNFNANGITTASIACKVRFGDSPAKWVDSIFIVPIGFGAM